jgi:hypothetical protein
MPQAQTEMMNSSIFLPSIKEQNVTIVGPEEGEDRVIMSDGYTGYSSSIIYV